MQRLCVTILHWIMSVLSDALELPEDLLEAVGLVRARIKLDVDYISGHETRTRQYLIDPVLTALGWDVLDPGLVVLEARVPFGSADYLGVASSVPRLVVEAKRLGSRLGPDPDKQVSRYARWFGLERAVVSDGNVWRCLGVTDMGSEPTVLLSEVTVEAGEVEDVADGLVALQSRVKPHV